MEREGKLVLNIFKFFTAVSIICFFTVNVYSQAHLLPPYYPENDSVRGPIYTIVDQQPSFNYKNGENFIESYSMYLKDSLRYPFSSDCHGRVFVELVVEKDGSLNNLRVIRGLSDCTEYSKYNKEAIRVILYMPKWTPGKQAGNNVRVRIILAVDF